MHSNRVRLVCIAWWAGFLGACSSEASLAETPITSAIVGGTVSQGCQWPTTAFVHGCSATLVHPRVLTFARHCVQIISSMGGIEKAHFGPTSTDGQDVEVEYCRSHPQYDFAYCLLRSEVTDIPPTPILMGCEAEVLKRGQKVTLVGYGTTGAEGSQKGTKRWVETTVQSMPGTVSQTPEIVLGTAQSGSCHGDSGGPAYVKLADGTWRAFGATSRAAEGGDCMGGTVYMLTPHFVPWLEKESGLDVTPCHDADGTWKPGPNCGGFAQDPHSGAGSWSNWCSNRSVSGASKTCGAAHSDSGGSGGSGGAAGASGGIGGTAAGTGGAAGGASGAEGAGGGAGGAGGAAGTPSGGSGQGGSGSGNGGSSGGKGGSPLDNTGGGAGDPSATGGAGGSSPASAAGGSGGGSGDDSDNDSDEGDGEDEVTEGKASEGGCSYTPGRSHPGAAVTFLVGAVVVSAMRRRRKLTL